MSKEENFVYRGPVRIYYANPVLGGDNEWYSQDASVYTGTTPTLIGILNHVQGEFYSVNLDHVALVNFEDWEHYNDAP